MKREDSIKGRIRESGGVETKRRRIRIFTARKPNFTPENLILIKLISSLFPRKKRGRRSKRRRTRR